MTQILNTILSKYIQYSLHSFSNMSEIDVKTLSLDLNLEDLQQLTSYDSPEQLGGIFYEDDLDYIDIFKKDKYSENLKNFYNIISGYKDFINKVTNNDFLYLSLAKPTMSIREFNEISQSSLEFTVLSLWLKSDCISKVREIDTICPGFMSNISKDLLTSNLDEKFYLDMVSQPITIEDLDSMISDIYGVGKTVRRTKGRFFKQLEEEVIPIHFFLQEKIKELGGNSVEFTIQNNRASEDSFDAKVLDDNNYELTKIECTCLLENPIERIISKKLFSYYGEVSYFHGIKTEEEVDKYIIENPNTPPNEFNINAVYEQRSSELYKLVIQAFDKKNNKDVYNQWNGNVILLIDYPFTKGRVLPLTERDLDLIKDHISKSQNKFKKGVYIQSPYHPPVSLL